MARFILVNRLHNIIAYVEYLSPIKPNLHSVCESHMESVDYSCLPFCAASLRWLAVTVRLFYGIMVNVACTILYD